MWFTPVSGLYFRLKAKEPLLPENGFCWIRQIQINWALRAEGLKERRRVCDTQTLGCDLVTEQQQILTSAWYYCISLCTDKEIEVYINCPRWHLTIIFSDLSSSPFRAHESPSPLNPPSELFLVFVACFPCPLPWYQPWLFLTHVWLVTIAQYGLSSSMVSLLRSF